MTTKKKVPLGRRRYLSRRMVVQALYQREVAGDSVTNLILQFRPPEEMEDGRAHPDADLGYFQSVLQGVVDKESELREQIEAKIDRRWDQCDPVERSVMLMGCYELMNAMEIPYRVVINEAVEQAKELGADQSHKYINGVLDKLAQHSRKLEIKAGR
ncbi:MAG: N utilization substance protein B [Pseudoalteromonas tetraodonis]